MVDLDLFMDFFGLCLLLPSSPRRSEDDRERGDLLREEPEARHRPLALLPLALRTHRATALHGRTLAELHQGLQPGAG